MSVYVCPKCSGPLRFQARGSRSAGYCECNPAGPVLECDTDRLDYEVLGADLFLLPGIKIEIVGAMVAQGITTLEDVCSATDVRLLSVAGIGKIRLARIREYLSDGGIPW